MVILAAGKGKRMGAPIPKPLVEVAGKPMIVHLLEHIKKSKLDPKPIVVVAPDNHDLFKEVLGDTVEYVVQLEPKGTGDALRFAEQACKEARHVIVLYGDHPFIGPSALKNVVKLLDKHEAALAMLIAEVPNFEGQYAVFTKWGRIIRDTKGQVKGICEAKDCSTEQLQIRDVNPGIYAFPTDWAFARLKELKNENASGEYYLVDLIAMAMDEGKPILTATVNPLDVVGVNTPEELKIAEQIHAKV